MSTEEGRLLAGQEATFDAFVAREYERMVRALGLFCGDRSIAEDLTQETFARAHQRWSKVAAMRNPPAWLYTVAFNLARSGLRRRAAERRAYARHGAMATVAEDGDRSNVLVMREAVASLPPRQREILIHRYFLGRSVAETADIVGVSEGTVKSATHRGIEALRAWLEEPVAPREGDHYA